MSTSYPAPLEAGQPSENMVTVTHLVYMVAVKVKAGIHIIIAVGNI